MKLYGGIRSLALAAALTLTAGLLIVVGSAPPATAATVVPCVRTHAATGGDILADTVDETPVDAARATVFLLNVPVSSQVLDIDVMVNASHANASNLRFDIDPTTGIDPDDLKRNVLMNRLAGSGTQVAPLTFDDQASAPYSATSPSGRYKPHEPLSENNGLAAGGTWRLIVYNWDATTTAKVNSWSVTITYSACDGDGDGAEDRAVDNCVGLANPDQLDLDSDGIGNECDGDLDGDGAVNNADNCLTLVNPDQADADGDGSGDVCDGDRDGDGVAATDNCPTVSNVDQADTDADGAGNACDLDDDADGKADAEDRCPLVGASTATGCPTVDRSLKLTQKKSVLAGRLSADLAGCQARQAVTVWQARNGKDRRIDRARSSTSGRFKTKLGRRTGKFYAKVPGSVRAGVAECSAVKSRKVTVRRR